MNPLWLNEQSLERVWGFADLEAKLVWEVFTRPHRAGWIVKTKCGSTGQHSNDFDIICKHDQVRWLQGPEGQLQE